jgi:hypothetical protein
MPGPGLRALLLVQVYTVLAVPFHLGSQAQNKNSRSTNRCSFNSRSKAI